MSYADGSGGAFSKPARLRRARSPVRTSPLVSELTLTCEALPFAAGLAPLTCRAAPVNSSTFAALTTPEGLRSLRSASSLSFLVTCQRQVIPSHSFAALAALIVRRVNGFANQPMPVCISRRATPKGVERVPGSGTLPSAYFPVFGGATLAPGRSDGASRICRGSLSPANISVSRR